MAKAVRRTLIEVDGTLALTLPSPLPLALASFMIYNIAMQMVFRIVMAVLVSGAGGMLCTFYWSGDDAGSWTPWWEVIVWLILTIAGIPLGILLRFPASLLFSFASPALGMIPVAIVVHCLKKKHPEE